MNFKILLHKATLQTKISLNKNFNLWYNCKITHYACNCRHNAVISEKGEDIQQKFCKPQLVWLIFLIGKSTEEIQVHVKIQT